MNFVTLSKNSTSCDITKKVFLTELRYSVSQAMCSISKKFVGSSRSIISGFSSNSRASMSFARCPPESVPITVSYPRAAMPSPPATFFIAESSSKNPASVSLSRILLAFSIRRSSSSGSDISAISAYIFSMRSFSAYKCANASRKYSITVLERSISACWSR